MFLDRKLEDWIKNTFHIKEYLSNLYSVCWTKLNNNSLQQQETNENPKTWGSDCKGTNKYLGICWSSMKTSEIHRKYCLIWGSNYRWRISVKRQETSGLQRKFTVHSLWDVLQNPEQDNKLKIVLLWLVQKAYTCFSLPLARQCCQSVVMLSQCDLRQGLKSHRPTFTLLHS